MVKTVTATEARVHFGEVMRQAQKGPIVVERDGIPKVVMISKEAYDELVSAAPARDRRNAILEAHRLVRADLAGRSLPSAEETIGAGREDRSEQLDDLH
jgi:prevent-host-death family protein